MKSKVSTGYLTPQPSRSKKIQENKHSGGSENFPAVEFNDSAFQKLMSCPVKRKLVLKLIESEKDNIEKYKKNIQERKQQNASPLHKFQTKPQCESPTALLRRRALANQNSPLKSIVENLSRSNSVNSTSSDKSCSNPSPIHFEELLAGVIAFVEVKSKGQDRSGGVTALMVSMGATVRDSFTKDVTHVVFKDGSYTTFQKAKLMNIHLVSVLWIEAVRCNNRRVPEANFPALGTDAFDHNVSKICSQMQKDYEDILKDELQRSLNMGTALPSKKTLIDRRRTMKIENISSSSLLRDFSQETFSDDNEVEQIVRRSKIYKRMTMDVLKSVVDETELFSDDDDDESRCDAVINGDIISKRRSLNLPLGDVTNNDLSNMDLTGISLLRDATNRTPDNVYEVKTPKMKLNRKCSNVNSDENSADVENETLYKRRTKVISPTFNLNKSHGPSKQSASNLLNGSPVPSNGPTILNTFSKAMISDRAMDCEKSVKEKNLDVAQNLSSDISSDTNMSSLKISEKDPHEKSSSTNMSILQISSDKSSYQKTSSTNMSDLQLSSEHIKINAPSSLNLLAPVDKLFKKPSNKNVQDNLSFSSGDKSFSPLETNTVNSILETLQTPSPVDGNTANNNHTNSAVVKSMTGAQNLQSRVSLKGTSKGKPRNNATNRNHGQSEHGENLNDSSNISEINNKFPKNNVQVTRRSTRIILRKSTCTINKCGDCNEISNSSTDVLSSSEKPNEKSKTRKRKSGENPSNTVDPSDSNTRFDLCGSSPTKKTKDEGKNKAIGETESFCKPKIPQTSFSTGKTRRFRKLYDPDTVSPAVIRTSKVSDDDERQHKRQQVPKDTSDDCVFLTGNTLSEGKKNLENNISETSSCDTEDSEIEVPLKPQRIKQKNTPSNLKVNADRDEQRELYREIIKEAKANVGDITTPGRTPRNVRNKLETSSADEECDKKKFVSVSTSKIRKKEPIQKRTNTYKFPVYGNRRSTLEFQSKADLDQRSKLKIDKLKQPTIVCTKFHKDDIMMMSQIVKKLGKFVIEDEVSSKTTHLVVGEPKRTINMLRAMSMGCWILKQEWMLKSLEVGKWLPEEDYEETSFSPAVQESRLHRQAFGPTYTMDIFKECGQIYVAKGSIPRSSDLRELISLCKGKVTTICRNATILVGGFSEQSEVTCVKETWVLDSITRYKKLPFKNYLIKSDNSVIV